MIDIKKEIDKYKPVLEMEDIEKDMNKDEIKDIMELIRVLKLGL